MKLFLIGICLLLVVSCSETISNKDKASVENEIFIHNTKLKLQYDLDSVNGFVHKGPYFVFDDPYLNFTKLDSICKARNWNIIKTAKLLNSKK